MASSSDASRVASRYIQAIQRQDFKTIIDLTSIYQENIANFKAQNPQSIWQKQISDFYNQEISDFSIYMNDEQRDIYFLARTAGDPIQSIKEISKLVPNSCKWSITEIRPKDTLYLVYVTVTYPSIDDAPMVGFNRPKQAILSFTVTSKSKLIQSMDHILAGDIYWPIPSPPPMVSDCENILDTNQIRNLTSIIKDFEQKTSNEIVIVTVESISPYTDLATYSFALANYWGVGKNKDKNNGLTIVVSKQLRQVRISPGNETNKILRNDICQKIATTKIVPELKTGNYYQGIKNGLLDLIDKWK